MIVQTAFMLPSSLKNIRQRGKKGKGEEGERGKGKGERGYRE
jgi:hypothetical protein